MTVPEKKHAPAILITLTEVREVIWNKDTEKLTKKTNVYNLILELDKMKFSRWKFPGIQGLWNFWKIFKAFRYEQGSK